MTADSAFWNRHATRYAKSPVRDQEAYEHKLRITREHFQPDMEVFEFGCGTGTTALHHAPFVRHILATDISEKMIEIARAKGREKRVDNVTFRPARIEDLAIADATYDAVMAHSILHLLEDRAAAIAKARRILKPGGVFVSSTACLRGVVPWLRYVLPLGRALRLLPRVTFFTPEQPVEEIAQAGFQIEYTWQPSPKQALFVVARKPEGAG